MTALYWFALVVGGGMYLFSVFADASHGHAGTDAHLDHGDGHDVFKVLSLRNATYFLFAFGVTGVLLTWMWGGNRSLLTAVTAIALGLLGGSLSALTFSWLRKSESGEMPNDRAWLGATADVLLPLSADGTGKIIATRAAREQELLARPFDEAAEHPERWTSVVVLEMRDGIALVAPNESSLTEPAPPRLGSSSET